MRTGTNEGTSGLSRGARAARWVLGAAIAGSALAIGTVHTVTLGVVTAVLAVAALLAWRDADAMRARPSATLLLFTGIGLTAYTAMQCLPLPQGLLAAIAPHNADVWARALSPLHEEGPTWAPLSLDPGATRVEVLRGLAYLLAFVAALAIARRREGVAFLSAAVVVTGLTLAIIAVLHPAFGAQKLYGLYTPGPGIAERHLAPLMNPNNLAGYLNLAFALALAAALAPDPRVPRPIAGAVVILLGAAQVWVASRGGVVTMVLAAVVVLVIAHFARRQRTRPVLTVSLVTGGVIAISALLIVLGGSHDAWTELGDANVSKLAFIASVFRVIPVVPFFGFGRGSFESAFPAFRTAPGNLTYTHPENVVAQWLLEWGVPIGLLGLAAILFALRPTIVLARSATAGGAWAALVALGVQNLGDLGTEIPGLMIAATVCAAIVVGGSAGTAPASRLERWAQHPRRVVGGLAVASLAALSVALARAPEELHADEGRMYAAALAAGSSSTTMHGLARASMERHPAEPYFPFITAVRAVRRRDESPMPWLGAALERAKTYGPAHALLAQFLASRSPSQARLEYRLAMEQAPELTAAVMADGQRVVRGYFDALELLPAEPAQREEASELLVQAVRERLPATVARLDADRLAQRPTAKGPVRRVAESAVLDLELGPAAPWCEARRRDACIAHAMTKAGLVRRLAPSSCEGFALQARAQVAAGDGATGLAGLERAVDQVDDRVACLRQLVALARWTGNEVLADESVEKIVDAGCSEASECAENLLWAGREYESSGKVHKALALYKRAIDRLPNDLILAHVAELAASEGLHVESASDYDLLAHKHPDFPEWGRLAAAQRDQALRSTVHF